MTREEIQQEILKINLLIDKCNSQKLNFEKEKKKLFEMEEGLANIISKIVKSNEDVIDGVVRKSAAISVHNKFKEEYCREVKKIFGGKEENSALSSLQKGAKDVKKKIISYEDKIKECNKNKAELVNTLENLKRQLNQMTE